MKLPGAESSRGLEDWAFLGLVMAVSLGFLWIMIPLYGAILWGVVIAVIFYPLNRRLVVRMGQRRNWAALATLAIIVVIVILPLTLLIISLAAEASSVYARMQAGELNFGRYFQQILESMPPWAGAWLDRLGIENLGALKEKLATALSEAGQIVAVHAINIGQNTFSFFVSLFVMLYLLFFLLRDGPELYQQIRDAVPLRTEHKRALFRKFAVVARATVKGNLVVALVQGTLGGLIFWVLGIQAPLLWAALMTLLALLPAVGAAVVWLPVAVYLLATGSVGRGIILLVFGLVVISLVDNLLRPLLIGKDTKMPDYVVLTATLGGLATFGIHGFVIGPVLAAMFISVWGIFSESK